MAQKLNPSPPSETHAQLAKRYYLLTLAVCQALQEDNLEEVGALIAERERVLLEMDKQVPSGDSLTWLQRAVRADEELNLRLTDAYANMKSGLIELFKERKGSEIYSQGEAAIHTVEEAA